MVGLQAHSLTCTMLSESNARLPQGVSAQANAKTNSGEGNRAGDSPPWVSDCLLGENERAFIDTEVRSPTRYGIFYLFAENLSI